MTSLEQKRKIRALERPENYNELKRERAKLRAKAWREKNKDKYKADAKVYRENNREYYSRTATNHNRQKKTGFTPEAYTEKLYEQDFSCGICGIHLSEYGKEFAADHDHNTGKTRGLLCTNCNVALGMFKDSIVILENALHYLKDYQ